MSICPSCRTLQMPYDGLQRKLIIAFDVGTTFSGVTFALLIPGEPPVIQGVTQFPGQKVGGDSKIPSVVCYDQTGNTVAIGSEADIDINPELLENGGLVRAEWFKLHLRPSHLIAEQGFDAKDIPPLPPHKKVIDIFADLLRYMYQSTKQYIQERTGDDTLESFGDNIDFILSHPNGWEGKQQSEMRSAAVTAGLVTDELEARERISFVTEGEASLHFCLNKVSTALEKHEEDGILVVDCGGGTIDISTYARSSSGHFKEIAAAECLLQGSFFVTQRAQKFLTVKLQGSKFGNPEDIESMMRYFDRITKPFFKKLSTTYFVRFGRNENEPEFDIRLGSIKMSGSQIAEFFEPALQSIIQVVEGQLRTSSVPIKAIFMVGGFATSDYLFSKLDEHFKPKGINILRPDAYLNKAVAEGAIIFKINHSVTSRVSKYAHGIKCSNTFDPENPDHVSRAHKCVEQPSGALWVPSAFSCILPKDTEVAEEKEFRQSFVQEYNETKFNKLSTISEAILCYRNRSSDVPMWVDQAPDSFPIMCIVTADISGVKTSIRAKINPKTLRLYYKLVFDIILLFGLTELKAQIAWKEDGVERRGPASIVYDIANDG